MAYLSNDLVTSVKARANVPTSQNTFQTADFLRFADEETRAKLIPLIFKNLEEYYVRTYDYALVANQAGYLIPTRAIAGKLRDVQLVSITDDQNRIPVQRLSPEDISIMLSDGFAAAKQGFYLEGNKVILYPKPTSASQYVLRLSYYIRPSSLVDISQCALVTAINTGTNQLTVSSVPSTFSISSPVDFVKANPGFECSAIDQMITNIAGSVLTFTALPTDIQVGDYVCLANQTCVVQVPVELQPLLFQYVVIRVLAAQSDTVALKAAMAELRSLEESVMVLISPRVDGKAKRVTNGRGIARLV